MYKIFTDKNEEFKCNIDIEGASLSNAKARLVVETKDYCLQFPGEIDPDGKCSINIVKLKMLNEGLTGTMKLEVIADDTYFTPWEDQYVVEKSKKVSVVVESQKTEKPLISESKPSVKISGVKEEPKNRSLQNESLCFIEIKNKLTKSGITVYNLKENNAKFKNIINESINKYDIKESNRKTLTTNILKFLSE